MVLELKNLLNYVTEDYVRRHQKKSLIQFYATVLLSLGLLISASSQAYAVTFLDHTGYIPTWASTMGESQAISVCSNSVQFGTADFKWCGEFAGYISDQTRTSNGNSLPQTGNIPQQQSAVPEFGNLVSIIFVIGILTAILGFKLIVRCFPLNIEAN